MDAGGRRGREGLPYAELHLARTTMRAELRYFTCRNGSDVASALHYTRPEAPRHLTGSPSLTALLQEPSAPEYLAQFPASLSDPAQQKASDPNLATPAGGPQPKNRHREGFLHPAPLTAPVCQLFSGLRQQGKSLRT